MANPAEGRANPGRSENVAVVSGAGGSSRALGAARLGLELAVNIGLPALVFGLARGRLGDAPALMAAAVPPVLWSLAEFLRVRRLDAIALIALAGIGLSLLAFAGGGGVKMLQLRETLVSGLVGLVFLGSAAIGRPLIFVLARAAARRRSGQAGEVVSGLAGVAGFRRAMTLATLAWGAGLLGACAAGCALVFVLPVAVFLVVGPVVSYGVIGALTAWTFWFVPRALRKAGA